MKLDNKIIEQYHIIEYLPNAYFVFNGEYDAVGTPYYIFINENSDGTIMLSDLAYTFWTLNNEYHYEEVLNFAEENQKHGFEKEYFIGLCLKNEVSKQDIDKIFSRIKDIEQSKTSKRPVSCFKNMATGYQEIMPCSRSYGISIFIDDDGYHSFTLGKYKRTKNPYSVLEQEIDHFAINANGLCEFRINGLSVSEEEYAEAHPYYKKIRNRMISTDWTKGNFWKLFNNYKKMIKLRNLP